MYIGFIYSFSSRSCIAVGDITLLHITMAKQPNRYWCEDVSPTLKQITSSKKNKKTIEKNGIIYEYVGDDLLFNTKTNQIEKI